MIEIWKDIKGYEGYYQVSNQGRVKSLSRFNSQREIILKQTKNKGYMRVHFSKDNSSRTPLVHKLVGQTFIPNLKNKPEINHINGNKQDNKMSNLEWVTSSENQLHALKMGLQKIVNKKPIYCYELNKRFESLASCCRYLILNKYTSSLNEKSVSGMVRRTIKNKKMTAYGLTFDYIENHYGTLKIEELKK